MASRKVIDLTPKMQELWLAFDKKMKGAGINYALTCTSRSILEQCALFVQGRLNVEDVNRFREIANMPPISQAENKVVTWTLHSRHVTNMLDSGLNNDYAQAFDIVILRNENITWDIKCDVNENSLPDYQEAGEIGESVGLVWGGRWTPPDYPHYQEP